MGRDIRIDWMRKAAALVAVVGTLSTPGIAGAQTPGRIEIPIGAAARTPAPLPGGATIELTLDRAIALALQNTLDLTVASASYEKAGFGIGAANGAFDPYVQLDASAGRQQSPVFQSFQSSDSRRQTLNATFGGALDFGLGYTASLTNTRADSPVTSTTPGFQQINPTLSTGFTLSASQPLLRNFGKEVNRRLIVQARIGRDQAAWDFVRTVQTTVQSVETAYWDLAYAFENLKAKQEALDRARDLNRITKIKIDVGALAPIDIVQTEVTIAQREQDIILAESAIGDASDRLKRLLNVTALADWSRPLVALDRPQEAKVEIDVEAGVRRALETRPEVKQAVVDIESRKISVSYNRNQLLPRLDLRGSYGWSGLGANTTVGDQEFQYSDAYEQIGKRNYPAWSLALVFNMNLGNKTARANAATASVDLDLARTNLVLLKQNLNVEVRAAARAVDTAYRSVLAAKKARELAERNLDAEKKKYENGMTTSFQVSQIQNDLTNARSAELLTIAAYVKSVVAWHKATGDLLDVKNVVLTGLPVSLEATPAEEGSVR